MKILVADDSKTNLELLTHALTKLGHEVMPAKDGLQAIELFHVSRPDLIILDVVMQGIDGFECAQRLRAIDPDDWIPIIFLSGAVDDENIAKGINAGGDDYLTKPFSEITLAAKIKAMQRIANMRQKLFETTRMLSTLSSTDTLTGINNRLHFEKVMKERVAVAARHNEQLAVLFIDVDNFKMINDNLGHPTGDLLLIEIAKRLQACLRTNDFIARMGGDEFAIILSKLDSIDAAGQIAQKIINALVKPYKLDNNTVNTSCSIGVACYPFAGSTPDSLIQSADIAMYHAKGLGRNNYQYYSNELNEKYKQEIYLENSLKHALERDEMFLMYQPIFNLATRNIVGMEALLRWKHPTRGMISPLIFIPIAEESGIITPIGRWVLQTACEQCKKWYIAGHQNFRLTVNVSSRQLQHKNFPLLLLNILNDTKIPAYLLELEISETIFSAQPNTFEAALKEITDIGISISIDHFGKGYSSFSYLKKLPIRAIKIDQSFTQGITNHTNDATITTSLIALGKNLGLSVVAEGIETQEQLNFLLENKCPQGQGFYLSEVLTVEQMTMFLKMHDVMIDK